MGQTLIAKLNSQKKHSVRYDLVRPENEEKIIGSIYWPKDLGAMPKEITVNVKD